MRVISSILLILTYSVAQAGVVDESQKLLNQLGYNAGGVDGVYGGKTERALIQFYKDRSGEFDGKLSSNELTDLYSAVGIERKVGANLAGVYIENNQSFPGYPPSKPGLTGDTYWYDPFWTAYDMNYDGMLDYIYTGTMIPSNQNTTGKSTGGACGGDICRGSMPGPTLFMADKKGNYKDVSDKFIDKRKVPGQSLSRQSLIADYNGDGTPDMFIADHAVGTHEGIRDSYFLSQQDGTWLESSATHLSHSNYKIFDHGAATGDIDGDGDFDIVLANLNGTLICWINNGEGKLKKRTCGRIKATGIELADFDNDGDLDLIHGGHEGELGWDGTGIMVNNGNGEFHSKIKFPGPKRYLHVPEVSAWDLDKDGDFDAVISRVGTLYVGTAVEVLENLGGGKFSSTLFEVGPAPESYVPKHEGNEWNSFVVDLKFADVDKDGDYEVVLVGGGHQSANNLKKVQGAILQNNGNMNFRHIPMGHRGNPITYISNSKFEVKVGAKVSLALETLRTGPSKKTKYHKAFKRYLADKSLTNSSASGYSLLDNPIHLTKSGISIIGAKNIKVSKDFAQYDALLEWGEFTIETNVCTEFYDQLGFTATRLGFDSRLGFGGIDALRKLGTNWCKGRSGYVGDWEIETDISKTGVLAMLEDLNHNGRQIVAALPGVSMARKTLFLNNTK
jgi:hypothetical protein